MKWFFVISVILLCLLVTVLWQRSPIQEQSEPVSDGPIPVRAVKEPIRPIPLQIKLNPNKIELGKKLFHDPQLSRDNSISCASCHDLKTGGTDRRIRSIGIDSAVGSVNAPTVFNSGFNFKQFWDGRAETLEDQIDGPLNSPDEMGSSWEEVVTKLKKFSDYVSTFGDLYPDGIQAHNIKDAIATFERSLYTPNSPADQFLRGDSSALTDEEKTGYRLFKSYGCTSCHQGIGVGGNMFERFGVMGDYFAERGKVTEADLGRFNVTGDERDRYVFKVPSLRNVALTPPYFHDGSARRLEDAVATMAEYQLGRKLSPEEIDRIVKFLKTLTGEYGGKPL
ncbi:MAG: cytochrome-c peroxidase [Candidatus Poribacteria bacterium]|nr:cytochrome-c peroxidase [Candidatus Poribacteria bacterium]